MAQSLKTVAYAFPTLASLTNNTLTNFTQITVNLPESSKTIRKAWVELSMDDIITATGGSLTTKTVNLRLGAAAYTSTTNANTLTHSGESISLFLDRDFTSHFVTNWTGTSMTCDVQLQINQSTGTTLGQVNLTCILYITYEFDDTSATQLVTAWIPLNAPTGELPTTKTSHDTIPALDTYLPEASKTYRNISIVTHANRTHQNTTDHTVTYELSTLGTVTTGNYEAALTSDVWSKYVWEVTSYITTNTTHSFNVWSSLAGKHDSMQAYMIVTYEYDLATTTGRMNTVMLPMEIPSPMGVSATDYQRASREFFVQEPNPSLARLAFYMTWQAGANEAGLNVRVGTGSFVAFTNQGSAQICGNKGLMIRNDAPTGLTFARGRNKLQIDCYTTNTAQRGGAVGGFWIVNYTSDIASATHNHTVLWPLHTEGTGATAREVLTTSAAPIIPEANYYITAVGFHMALNSGLGTQQGISVKAERLVAEGGLIFEPAHIDISHGLPEFGRYDYWSQVKFLFTRFPNDADASRLPIETNRRYLLFSSQSVVVFSKFSMMLTYHSITSTIADSVSGFSGTVTISAHRADGEKILETTRSGDGAFSFTWYDNTEPIYIVASGSVSGYGRSEPTLPVLD